MCNTTTMLQDLFNYYSTINAKLEDRKKHNWRDELALFMIYLNYLQKERHYHLLVMLTTGMATLMVFLVSIIHPNFFILILDLTLACLFLGYIMHYRKLENTAQDWYTTLDKIIKLIGSEKTGK